MEITLDKAMRCGVGSVVATYAGHFGAAARHASLVLERNMIGLALIVGGLEVVPTFGAQPWVGLNPIGIAVPIR